VFKSYHNDNIIYALALVVNSKCELFIKMCMPLSGAGTRNLSIFVEKHRNKRKILLTTAQIRAILG